MDISKLFEIIVPFLEKSGMGTLIVVCFSAILVASTILIVAWMFDHKSTKSLFKSIFDLINFSKKRFEKVNKSPFDESIANSKTFQIIEFSYLYSIFFTLLIYGGGTVIIGLTADAKSLFGNIAVIVFGIFILIFARFCKVAADKSFYKFKNGKDWDDKT